MQSKYTVTLVKTTEPCIYWPFPSPPASFPKVMKEIYCSAVGYCLEFMLAIRSFGMAKHTALNTTSDLVDSHALLASDSASVKVREIVKNHNFIH